MIKNIVDEDNEGFRKRLEVEKMDLEGEDNLEQGEGRQHFSAGRRC